MAKLLNNTKINYSLINLNKLFKNIKYIVYDQSHFKISVCVRLLRLKLNICILIPILELIKSVRIAHLKNIKLLIDFALYIRSKRFCYATVINV